MIGSSERGLHVTIAAVLEKNTDVANIRILSPSGLFDCLDFLFTQSEMCAFLLKWGCETAQFLAHEK